MTDARKRRAAAPRPDPIVPVAATLGDALLALPRGACRWPMDIDDPRDVRFCGQRATQGAHRKAAALVYCDCHAERSKSTTAAAVGRQELKAIPVHA